MNKSKLYFAFLAALVMLPLLWRKSYYQKGLYLEKDFQQISYRINLNEACKSELTLIPGIGLALADKIYNHRKKFGKFSHINELLCIKGLGPHKVNLIRSMVCANPDGRILALPAGDVNANDN